MFFQEYNFVFFFGLVIVFCFFVSLVNKDVDFIVNIVLSICQIEINNNGVVDFGIVILDYFFNNIILDMDYVGGKNFIVNVVFCDNL